MATSYALFGLVGFLGCFLPMVFGVSWFDLRHVAWLSAMVLIAAYAVPAFLGLSDVRGPLPAIVSVLCFGFITWQIGFDIKDLIIEGQLGGKMMGVGALGGLVTSVGALAKKN